MTIRQALHNGRILIIQLILVTRGARKAKKAAKLARANKIPSARKLMHDALKLRDKAESYGRW